MKEDRMFYSPSKGLTPHIQVLDVRGKLVKEKVCQFTPEHGVGVYIALTAEQSEIEIDEAEKLRSHSEYGIWIFDSTDWQNYQLSNMNPGSSAIVQRTIQQKDSVIIAQEAENRMLKAKIEELAQIRMSSDEGEMDIPLPRNKAGRPKKNQG